MPTPLKVSAKQAKRLQRNAAANVQPIAVPAAGRSYRDEANRLRGVLALVRRLLVIGTPPARVVAVLDGAMEGMDKEQQQ